MKNPEPFSHYLSLTAMARKRILDDSQILKITKGDSDDLAMLFLMYFSAFGIEMTRPVDGWIERAGIRCKECGFEELGSMLVKHAAHERGHHEMLERDLEQLVSLWNESHDVGVSCNYFRSMAPTPSMGRYAEIHEDAIRERPNCQLAIEYEIENMSIALGPVLIQVCGTLIGHGSSFGLSFIREHSVLDIGHTAMNEAHLRKFLSQHPSEVEPMAEAGAEALNIYLDFLGECVAHAECHIESLLNGGLKYA